MGLLCRTAATRIRLRPVNTTLRQAIHSTMAAGIHDPVMQGIAAELPRLWRYGLVLSGNRDTAEDLVQATCVRAIERAHQFQPGTRLDRWLIAILHSIWLNEIRSRKVRQGQGLVDADAVLVFDGMKETETNILAAQVLREVQGLPEVQRETVYLVYVEGLTYREAAETLAIPIGTVMSRLAAARAKLAGLGTEAKAAATHPRQARE
jgi:RNA polymerase sigma-70 factor, ECF subfamily